MHEWAISSIPMCFITYNFSGCNTIYWKWIFDLICSLKIVQFNSWRNSSRSIYHSVKENEKKKQKKKRMEKGKKERNWINQNKDREQKNKTKNWPIIIIIGCWHFKLKAENLWLKPSDAWNCLKIFPNVIVVRGKQDIWYSVLSQFFSSSFKKKKKMVSAFVFHFQWNIHIVNGVTWICPLVFHFWIFRFLNICHLDQ